MAGLTRKKITVKRKGKTFQRSVMVKSDSSKAVVRRHRGAAVGHGMLSGLGAGIGGYAAKASGRSMLAGGFAGGALTSLGVLHTKSAKRLARDTTKDFHRGGNASTDLAAYRGAGMAVGGMVGAAGARLAHGLYNHYRQRRQKA